MCVCVRVCICVSLCGVYVPARVCVYVHTHMCAYVCMYTYVCVHVCVCTHTHVCVHVCVCTHTHVCVSVIKPRITKVLSLLNHSVQVNSISIHLHMKTQNLVLLPRGGSDEGNR